jgi:hypothetical protein
MKWSGLMMCGLLMIASSASADLIGSWSAGEPVMSGSTAYTKYILTVTPTEGEKITGWDLMFTSSVTGTFKYTGGLVFNSEIAYTGFLFDTMNADEADNLVVASSGVSGTLLKGGFARASTGDYAAGWSTATDVAQFWIKDSTGVTPDTLTITATNTSYAPRCDVTYAGGGTGKESITFGAVPEPGTIALLLSGMIGLVAYAWRKRK